MRLGGAVSARSAAAAWAHGTRAASAAGGQWEGGGRGEARGADHFFWLLMTMGTMMTARTAPTSSTMMPTMRM